uniref:Uncharacterized protein n=1 Tax=Clytia hemisphaerica TaxID=252671 RepID=A0A7M5XMB0_9CNID
MAVSSFKCLNWLSCSYFLILLIILIVRLSINRKNYKYKSSPIKWKSDNVRPLSDTVRSLMISVLVIVSLSSALKILLLLNTVYGFALACSINFIMLVSLAVVMLTEDGFTEIDKGGFDFFIVALLFVFALLEVVIGCWPFKKACEGGNDERNASCQECWACVREEGDKKEPVATYSPHGEVTHLAIVTSSLDLVS